MCNQLILGEYPQARVVEGSGGDEGVDSFIGRFNGNIEVYQHKFITGRLTAGHKSQIKESLERVVEKHQPKRWNLCVPIEFTPSEIRWFEKLQEEFPETELAFWGEEKLKSLLAKHQHIREAFFPRELERMVQEIHEVVVERTEEPRFSILELEEVSTALAKRYSANVLMHGVPTRTRIREVVRQATEVVKRQTHYRSRLREKYWGDQEAHIVWLSFISRWKT